MKRIFRCFCAFLFFVTCFDKIPAYAATNELTGYRLTIELRDGSRIIGKSKEDEFKFHSETLGELKLPLKKIRFLERAGKTNWVKLITATKDTLSVEFDMKNIHVATDYADLKLPVDLIKSVQVSGLGMAGRPKDGLVGLWSGEDNGVDSVSGNNGVLQNVSFSEGVVGEAFSFGRGSSGYSGVQIKDHPAYALTHSLTIEGWVRPRATSGVIFFRGDNRIGLDPYALSIDGGRGLAFVICSKNANNEIIHAPITLGVWTHVAAVMDDARGKMSIYTNGVLASQLSTSIRPFGPLLPDASPGIGIGNVNDGLNNFPFKGEIDEMALYNRALSASEIKSIYSENAANAADNAEPFTNLSGFGNRPPSAAQN